MRSVTQRVERTGGRSRWWPTAFDFAAMVGLRRVTNAPPTEAEDPSATTVRAARLATLLRSA